MYQLVWRDGYGNHVIRSDDYQAVDTLFDLVSGNKNIDSVSLYDQFCNVIQEYKST